MSLIPMKKAKRESFAVQGAVDGLPPYFGMKRVLICCRTLMMADEAGGTISASTVAPLSAKLYV